MQAWAQKKVISAVRFDGEGRRLQRESGGGGGGREGGLRQQEDNQRFGVMSDSILFCPVWVFHVEFYMRRTCVIPVW